jgi:hypothetical protein
MSSLEYGRDALAAAARTLATGSEALRVRVKQAVINNLMELHPENLPDGMWGDFSAMLKRLERYAPKNGDGEVETTLRHMSDPEVEEVAREITKFSEKVASATPAAAAR